MLADTCQTLALPLSCTQHVLECVHLKQQLYSRSLVTLNDTERQIQNVFIFSSILCFFLKVCLSVCVCIWRSCWPSTQSSDSLASSSHMIRLHVCVIMPSYHPYLKGGEFILLTSYKNFYIFFFISSFRKRLHYIQSG